MTKREKISQNWKKVNKQLNEAIRFLKEGKLDEALYFVWLAAENIVNSLKVAVNGVYLKEHKLKTEVLRIYFANGLLKKDYAKTFENLSKFRIAAEFHPYTSIPRSYKGKDVLSFLEEIQGLKKEVEGFLRERKILE